MSRASSYFSPSSLLLPLLLLLLLLLACAAGAADDAACSDAFCSGQQNFVLDTQDAVREGAALLASERVSSPEDCQHACSNNPLCNLALLGPRGTGAATAEKTICVTFNCVYRNRFVCRFVNQAGYQTFIRQEVYQKHLQGPQVPGESRSGAAGDLAPPIAIAGRDVIVKPGETVTLNGIESLALGDAHIEHYRWTQESGEADVKMEKTDLPDQVRLSNLQPGSYTFQLTVIDSNSQSHDTKVKVLVLSPELTSLYCLAPQKVGPCRAMFRRWRYDAASGECNEFIFGGCKQNNNNFLSKDECLSACSGVKAFERSGALPAAEKCGETCGPRQLTCSSGCCVDRNLECDGVTHCTDQSDEKHCSKLNQTFTRLLDINVNQRNARCSEPPLTGPCRASHTRWYYFPLDRKCYRFTYGGCEGNENNFEEEDKCSETCSGVSERSVFFRGMFERYEKRDEEESDSGNIALAVLLSVAILALLAVITYCFLKNRKERSHRPVSTGPAHVALSEQDTLVYNSTTKPV
ncbi:kunitz-type protease inhibitor 1-like isoform X3 [Labrus mixtus]|uniref:kunitz-type protease inhibitor 1-like isoform X3 n=1 Tax=Labrus mixtus TaxID=508554 RepID=UPI0029BFD12F|nr:kunitz-type protease inhibitor 1-like isoform X3 [Labrus mixtus]